MFSLQATTRKVLTASVGAAILCGLTGCLHPQQKLVLLTVWRTPVQLETAPGDPPILGEPEADLPDVPVASAAQRLPPPRRRRPSTGTTTAASGAQASAVAADAATAAATTDPEPVDIGNLTTGGDDGPQARQDAMDLISYTDRRLKGLPSSVISAHRSQIARIKNFQLQAQHALNSGDADGAKTLATKGKLLLDDLFK